MTRMSVLLATVTVLGLFSACDQQDDQCGKLSDPISLDIVGVVAAHARAWPSDDPESSFQEFATITDQVESDQYRLFVYPSVESMASTAKRKHRFSLIASAYACSPQPARVFEEVVAINVTTENDFNSQYLAGSSLNSNIIVSGRVTHWIMPVSSETMTIDQLPGSLYASTGDGLAFEFVQAPANNLEQVFTIEYVLNSGEIYTVTTDPITFIQ